MASDVREELAAAGGGGDDDGLDPTLAPARGEPEAEESAGWIEELGDPALQDYARNKGWDRDPAKAITSYRELERAMTERSQDAAELEAQLAEYRAAAQQQEQQAGGQEADPILNDLDAIAAAYENGEIGTQQAFRYLFAAGQAVAEQRLSGLVDTKVRPIAERQHTATLEQTAAEIADAYPDFRELSDEVLALMAQHPSKYGDAEGMWAAYGLVKSKRQIAEQRESARASQAETLNTSSRGEYGLEAQDAIRKQLRDVRAPMRDGL